MKASNSARTRRRSSPFSERVWESAASTTPCECTATHQEQRAAEVHDEIGQRSLERVFPGLTESMTQATLSAGQSGIGFKRARDIAAPHLWALIAAKPRVQTLTQDADWAGLLPKQILEARLSEVIETASSTYFSSRDNDEQATAKLYVQKAAQTKLGSKQLGDCRDWTSQTRPSHPSDTQAPPPKTKTAVTWTSQRPGRADSVRGSSKRSFHGSLIALVSDV